MGDIYKTLFCILFSGKKCIPNTGSLMLFYFSDTHTVYWKCRGVFFTLSVYLF